MKISVIIPTCNRHKDLKEAISSLLKQTIIPHEIIIIDDSEGSETANLIKDMQQELILPACPTPDRQLVGGDGRRVGRQEIKNIELKYIHKVEEKSGAISRNIGIKNSTGEIVLFFDDDVVLDEDYIKEILRVYKEKPNALGVQGYIINRRKSIIKNVGNRLFFLVHSRKNINRLLPSMQNLYADPLDRTINCQWMVANNFSFKKEILNQFKFDENLKRISASEDDDLSYRIYKKYPLSLYQTPFAKLTHMGAGCTVRMQTEKAIFLTNVYQTYIFYKDIDQTFKNKLIFLWSKMGLLLIAFGATVFRLPEAKALRPLCLINAYVFCIKHLSKIKKGNINFFNKML